MGEMVYTLDEELPVVDSAWSPEAAAARVNAWSAGAPGEAVGLHLWTDDETGDMHGLVGDIADGQPVLVQAALDAAADTVPVELQDRTRGRVKALTALGAARSANKAKILEGKAPVIEGKKVSASTFKKITGESTGAIRKAAIGEAGSKPKAAAAARAQAAKSRKRARSAASAVHGKPGARVQPRSDAEQDSMMVSLPVPPEIAAKWPDMGDNGAPHITLVYIGPGSEVEFERVLKIVDKHAPAMIGQTVGLGGVGYFDEPRSQPDKRCAYATVDVTDACGSARQHMDADMRADGIEPVTYGDGEWVPHATLEYIAKDTDYTGPVPTGTWQIDAVDVHRNGEQVRMYGNGRMDRLAHRGGKWIALSADGKHEFGTYDTEAEARERLRQIEAAKASKSDGWGAAECMRAAKDCGVDLSDIEDRADRSDDEKAEIRSRWQKGGPNMGAARMREWLESPFAGPNRKSGDERDRARRVANRALRLMEKPTGEWTDADYTGALQVLAFIERMSEVEQGEPLSVDGREGPSARDASLRDWGFDPRADGRQDSARQPAPAVHTESRGHTFDIIRADKATMGPLVEQANGWRRYHVKYSRYGNVQPYVENGRTVYEYRDPKAVKDPASLETGRGVPWELRHSRDLLRPESVLGKAQGTTLTFGLDPDGEHTSGIAHAWGRDLFNAIDEGMLQVSMAYGATVDRRPGTADDGTRFDQRQIRVVNNSMATEPRGNAGTAEIVGPPRFDAANVITRADALLAIARADAAPSHPVYYDLRSWRTERTTTTRKDQKMDLLKALLQAAGKSTADLAAMLGVDEAGIEAALADEMAMKKAVAFLMGEEPMADGGDMPGAPDMAKVMVGDKDYEVPAAVAQRISELEGTADMATKRADAAEQAKRIAVRAKLEAETEAKKRQDAAVGMVSRADAEQIAVQHALANGRVIELAKRGLGFDFTPEPRQDAESGDALPITMYDWQCAALRGAFGDEAAAALITRLDSKTPDGRAAVLEEKLIEADEILAARQDTVAEVTSSIARNRAAAAANRPRQDADTDVIASSIDASFKFIATTDAKANGA